MTRLGANLLNLFRRNRRLSEEPFVKFTQVLLQKALAANASAIVFGVPEGVPWDFEQALQDEQNAKAELREQFIARGDWSPEDDMEFQDLFLEYENGITGLPIFHIIKGEPKFWDYSATNLLPLHLWKLSEHVVGIIEGDDDKPPRKYFELPTENEQGTRRFVELRLVMGKDHRIRLELLGVRETPRDVKLWRGIQS